MNKVFKWFGIDGLLHFFVSSSIVLAMLTMSCSLVTSICVAFFAGLLKEFWDAFVQKDNTWKQVLHDIICDIAGISAALFIYLVA
jgi:hypothetical protein